MIFVLKYIVSKITVGMLAFFGLVLPDVFFFFYLSKISVLNISGMTLVNKFKNYSVCQKVWPPSYDICPILVMYFISNFLVFIKHTPCVVHTQAHTVFDVSFSFLIDLSPSIYNHFSTWKVFLRISWGKCLLMAYAFSFVCLNYISL